MYFFRRLSDSKNYSDSVLICEILEFMLQFSHMITVNVINGNLKSIVSTLVQRGGEHHRNIMEVIRSPAPPPLAFCFASDSP